MAAAVEAFPDNAEIGMAEAKTAFNVIGHEGGDKRWKDVARWERRLDTVNRAYLPCWRSHESIPESASGYQLMSDGC